MAPPQLFINTKILELEKQPKNEKEDGSEDFESEDKQESGKKDKEKENNNDNDPVEDADGSDENRIARSLPILTYVVSPILVFTGLAIAIVGVSSNNDYGMLKWDHLLIFPGLSLGRQVCLPLFLRAWPSPVLTCYLLHCPRSWHNIWKAPVLLCPCLCQMG